MKKKIIIACLLTGAVIALFPSEALAQKTSEFASQEFIETSSDVQTFLFGPVMRIVGIIGGAYGLYQAIMSSSLKPLLVFGGIGLAVNLIPKFIDGVFNVSGMLVP